MKQIVLFGTWLLASLSVSAQEPSAMPTPWRVGDLKQTIAQMPQGDVERGAALHRYAACISCHGDQGIAVTRNAPSLAGNNRHYLYKSLIDYQTGLRNEKDGKADVMHAVTQPMTRQDMADLAVYYASQTPPLVTLLPVDQTTMQLVSDGDPKRLLTSCAACHGLYGQGGQTDKSTPRLAGMEPSYFVRTMKAYRDGRRDNDVHQGMAQFAKHLTDDEINALARYYAGDRPAY